MGRRWTDHYIDDMIALNVRPPDYFQQTTDVIAEIIHSVEDLICTGVAYVKSGVCIMKSAAIRSSDSLAIFHTVRCCRSSMNTAIAQMIRTSAIL